MIEQTFRGSTINQALMAVRQAFGNEAIIVSTRTVVGRSKHAQPIIEVVARKGGSALSSSKRISSSSVEDLQQLLARNEINGMLQDRLCDSYTQLAPPLEATLQSDILAEALASMIPISSVHALQRVVALVGPTGVGKTTTIAKLGMQDQERGLQVGFISTDQARIGGPEHLRLYAQLAEIPFREVQTIDGLGQALDAFHQLDRVYIDTSGWSPRQHDEIRSLAELLRVEPNIQEMLLLPASGNLHDLAHLLRSYQLCDLDALGISKLDETTCFGPCLATMVAAQLPLLVFGTGQNVPDDVESASAQRLVDTLYRAIH